MRKPYEAGPTSAVDGVSFAFEHEPIALRASVDFREVLFLCQAGVIRGISGEIWRKEARHYSGLVNLE